MDKGVQWKVYVAHISLRKTGVGGLASRPWCCCSCGFLSASSRASSTHSPHSSRLSFNQGCKKLPGIASFSEWEWAVSSHQSGIWHEPFKQLSRLKRDQAPTVPGPVQLPCRPRVKEWVGKGVQSGRNKKFIVCLLWQWGVTSHSS